MRVAVGLALGSLYLASRRPVLCEAPMAQLPTASRRTVNVRGVQRYGGIIDYHQMALGSFTGMITGWVCGKLSKIAVTLVGGTFLGLEWLQYSGVVDLSPFASTVYKWGLRQINTELVIKDPSFKWSFFAAFLVAAFNS